MAAGAAGYIIKNIDSSHTFIHRYTVIYKIYHIFSLVW